MTSSQSTDGHLEPRRPGRVLYFLPIAEIYTYELEKIKDCGMEVVQWTNQKKLEQSQRLMVSLSLSVCQCDL